jgi:hypothetical protein
MVQSKSARGFKICMQNFSGEKGWENKIKMDCRETEKRVQEYLNQRDRK